MLILHLLEAGTGGVLLKKVFWKIWQILQKHQTQPSSRKRCSENIHQIYKRTLMSKCDFNRVTKQLYWNPISAWVFSCKFAAYFQNTFFLEQFWRAASERHLCFRLFLIKLQVARPTISFKGDSNTGVFLWKIWKFLRKKILKNIWI